jgi:hypothetical protein
MSRNIPEIQQGHFLYLSDHPNQYFENITDTLQEGYNKLDKYDINASFIIKDSFLSARNLNLIQKWLCADVLNKTGITIPYQNLIHITEVANAIYDAYGQNLPFNLKEQIYELDMKVVMHLSEIIINELYARARYKRDIESANYIDNPKYMGSRGQRALPSTLNMI